MTQFDVLCSALSESAMIWISVILSLAVLAVVPIGLYSRGKTEKGIGWQFIRFTVLAISLPVCALLALNNALTGEAATIFAVAIALMLA